MKRAALILGLSLALPCFGQTKPTLSGDAKKATPAVKHECKAGPDEWCPPPDWWADYDHVKQLQKPYIAPPMPKDVADLINGIVARILGPTGGIPAGMKWDDAKQKAIKVVMTPPVQPTVEPGPAK